MKRFEPANDEERNLVQSLADTEWPLLKPDLFADYERQLLKAA
ncbi:MAG: hypothetical protein WB676_28200 [Bryobacteraceae bacterium]